MEEQYKKLKYRKYGGNHALPEGSHITPSVISEKNWNKKEDKGKSMMHALYVLRLAKRYISG